MYSQNLFFRLQELTSNSEKLISMDNKLNFRFGILQAKKYFAQQPVHIMVVQMQQLQCMIQALLNLFNIQDNIGQDRLIIIIGIMLKFLLWGISQISLIKGKFKDITYKIQKNLSKQLKHMKLVQSKQQEFKLLSLIQLRQQWQAVIEKSQIMKKKIRKKLYQELNKGLLIKVTKILEVQKDKIKVAVLLDAITFIFLTPLINEMISYFLKSIFEFYKGQFQQIYKFQQYMFASPIRSLQNNSYQEEFYRIKAQRLQKEVEDLKQENILLAHKLRGNIAAQKTLKQQNEKLQLQVSRRAQRGQQSSQIRKNFTEQSSSQKDKKPLDTSRINQQTQKLLKQIRVLKNDHDLEIRNLQGQIKKLMRRNQQLEVALSKNQNKPEKNKYQSNKSSVDDEIQTLRQQIQQARAEAKRLKKQKQYISCQVQNQDKQLSQLKKSLNNLKTSRQQVQESQRNTILGRPITRILKLSHLSEQKDNQYEQKYEKAKQQLEKKSNDIIALKQQINKLKQQVEEQKFAHNKQKDQKESLQKKIQQMQKQSDQKDSEFEKILTKLSPLLSKQKKQHKELKQGTRASLSLLQVLLHKHKIKLFDTNH